MNNNVITRGILWTAPRCRSTVFERSMRTLEDIRVFHEYFSISAYAGEEKFFQRYTNTKPMTNFKFSDVKNLYEGRFPGYKGVFVKDMAYCMVGKEEHIPEGYNHAILIRNPVHALTSLHRTITEGDIPEWADGFFPEEAGFRELWNMYEHLTNVKGINPTVIDSDDLLSDPASMMKKYCNIVGFQYTDDMLRWEPENDCEKWTWETDHFTWEKDWYGTVLASSGFIKKSKESMKKTIDVSSLPEYVQTAIQDAQPFYEKLYKYRIVP
ncbi:uncharacterized protein LOC144437903 [Glandiceps talaboti]